MSIWYSSVHIKSSLFHVDKKEVVKITSQQGLLCEVMAFQKSSSQ